MKFLYPNPKLPNTGYDDGYFGPIAVAVALHELAARKSGEVTFLVTKHHTDGGHDWGHSTHTVTVRYGKIDGEPRFRISEGGPEHSLAGGPTDPVEVSRAVAHLTAYMTRPGVCIYRVAS